MKPQKMYKIKQIDLIYMRHFKCKLIETFFMYVNYMEKYRNLYNINNQIKVYTVVYIFDLLTYLKKTYIQRKKLQL